MIEMMLTIGQVKRRAREESCQKIRSRGDQQ